MASWTGTKVGVIDVVWAGVWTELFDSGGTSGFERGEGRGFDSIMTESNLFQGISI